MFIRLLLALCLVLPTASHATPAPLTEPVSLAFNELYTGGVLGLKFTQKVERLRGKEVIIRGFMAPPLKAEADFFVLTREPVALCPFCSSDADWPDSILVVYLSKRQEFVQNNTTIEVRGVLEAEPHVDDATGFVSQLRLRNATFKTL